MIICIRRVFRFPSKHIQIFLFPSPNFLRFEKIEENQCNKISSLVLFLITLDEMVGERHKEKIEVQAMKEKIKTPSLISCQTRNQ